VTESFYGTDLAAVHHESFGAVARAAGATLLELLGERRGTVVDLGSGSGIMAARLTASGFDVIGIDRSPAMIALGEQEAPGARFVLGSLWDADLPPASR
jgi:SAM-dependent methyltransferase